MRRNFDELKAPHVRHPTSVVYYNASLFVPQDSQPVPAYITDARAQGLIDRPDDWEMSIVRFDMSANLLPPMVLPMPGPPAVGTVPSSLTVTLRSLGVDSRATVNINSSSILTYGFVYSISDLVDNINVALASAFAAMIPVAGVTTAPVLGFDPVTQLLSLYAESSYTTAPVEIYVNSPMYQYIDSMPAAFFGYNLPTGRDFRLQLESSVAKSLGLAGARAGLPVNVQAMPSPAQYISQQGVSLASMNGVRSVYITSSMPINNESLPTSNASSQNGNISTNALPIVSDFLLGANPAVNPVVDRISIEYLPTAEYRMVQMRGEGSLDRVDLKFWYTLFDGRVFEVLLPPGGFASAKIMFRRRYAD